MQIEPSVRIVLRVRNKTWPREARVWTVCLDIIAVWTRVPVVLLANL